MSHLALALVLAGATVAAGVAGASAWFEEGRRVRRRLRSLRVRSTLQVAEGEFIRLDGAVRAPLGTPVRGVIEPIEFGVACAIEVTRYDGRGKNRRSRVVAKSRETIPFILEVEGGALVRVGAATRVAFGPTRFSDKDILWQQSTVFDEFLGKHQQDSVKLASADGLRVSERIIAAGDRVQVAGRARWQEDPDGELLEDGYRGATRSKRLVLDDTIVASSPEFERT